ncbi:MAG: hypothetical protein KAS07_02480 [Candidatus Pacebacteria bacterium]|nr:hypothetical protein [Candidatus Paceibacterota bacterium]
MKVKQKRKKEWNIFFFGAFLVSSFFVLISLFYSQTVTLIVPDSDQDDQDNEATSTLSLVASTTPKEKPFVATHIETPDVVKGIYMTACVAGTPSFRNSIVKLIEETELNTVVIDIKDYTGTISFDVPEEDLFGESGTGCRANDMREFIAELHKKNIYVIGRVTVFQDPFYAMANSDQAVQKISVTGEVWTDYKGISFVDVGAKEYWKYIVDLSKASYKEGFDEINYDYIRFPSDGNMQDTYYPFSEERVTADWQLGKAKILEEFFAYLYSEMKDTGAVLSADLFGMTMTNPDDLNIGQILEYAAPYFDYIAPMVYPSHYPSGFLGYYNVNAHPYEIVKYSMNEGVRRLNEYKNSTTTPDVGRGRDNIDPLQLRPWLQDNDYPVHYTPEMVRAQIQATYDAGLTSWMLWDAGNTYTRAALESN